MTPPIIWYTDHDGIAVPTASPPPGAVPYMLARPQPIDTAPRDGTVILGWHPSVAGWRCFQYTRLPNGIEFWTDDKQVCSPTHWLPLPPAPEEA